MCCKSDENFWHQLLFLTAKCLVSFSGGVNLAFPSILNAAILAPDAEIKATPDQASWIATSLGISGLVSYIIIPSIFEMFGRKITNIVISLITLIGGIIFYVANDVTSLVCARLTQGLGVGGNFVSAMTICECISPKRRGYFLVLYKIMIGMGSLACHALAFVFNWRQIAIFGALPNCISIILFMISAESPSFFAKRGQFDMCAKAFKWYRGDSLDENKELKELISAQKEILRMKQSEKKVGFFKILKSMLLTNDFRKSFYIVTLATLCLDSCGRYFLLAYITPILVELTNNTTSAMYISVAFDCILIFSLCISSVLVKHFKRRTLLFKLGFCSVLLMFMVSFSIILRKKLKLLQDEKWLTPALILLHTFITNIGLAPVAFALTGEVFSLEHRGLGSIMSGIVFLFFFNVVIKLTPTMIDTTGVEGTYSIYGFCLFISLILLQAVLPETKDKTLQQIEDEIKGVVRKKSETESLNCDEFSKSHR